VVGVKNAGIRMTSRASQLKNKLGSAFGAVFSRLCIGRSRIWKILAKEIEAQERK
jgi:hypothetical protein